MCVRVCVCVCVWVWMIEYVWGAVCVCTNVVFTFIKINMCIYFGNFYVSATIFDLSSSWNIFNVPQNHMDVIL